MFKKINLEHHVMVIAFISAFLVAFLSSSTSIAVPSIAKEFAMTNIIQNWVVSIFLLVIAILSVPVGNLSARWGLKKSLILGLSVFLIGSFLAAVSISTEIILFSRVIQGIGATFLNVAGMAMLVAAIPPNKRGKALGINIAGVYIGLSLAPILGGILTYNLGWRSIFFINIPFLVLTLFLTIKISKEWIMKDDTKFDLKGTILYSIAILLFVYGFTIINEFIGIVLTILGLVLLVAFTLFELRIEHPLFNIRLFKNVNFSSASFASLISYFATFVVTTILNYHLQYVLGMNAQTSGMILIAMPIMMAILAPISGKLSDIIHPQKLTALGMILATIAMVILAFLVETSPLYVVIIALIFVGLGLGLFSSPNTNSIMGSVPKKETPSASATVSTMRVIGQTMSLSMLTVIFAIVMGDVPMIPQYFPQLVASSRISCGISAILCLIAFFACLFGLRSTKFQ